MINDITPNKNGVTDRRAASPKRENDVTQSQWPVVTITTYQQLFAGKHEETMSLKVRQLCLARIRLQQFFLACDGAMRNYSPQMEAQSPEVYRELQSIRNVVEKAFLKFPMTLVK